MQSRLATKNYKGEIWAIPSNISWETVIYGREETAIVTIENKFEVPMEDIQIEVIDGENIQIEQLRKLIPAHSSMRAFKVRVLVPSRFSEVEMNSLMRQSELRSGVKTPKSEIKLAILRIFSNLPQDLVVPITYTPEYGRLTKIKSLSYQNAMICQTATQQIEIENPSDQPISVSFFIGLDLTAADRKKCEKPYTTAQKRTVEVNIEDDEEFENRDPRDYKYCDAFNPC